MLMKRLVIVLSLLAACAAIAQDRPSALDKAYEDVLTAERALKDAEARRGQGVEPQPGERRGTATGGSRPTEQ